MKHLIKYAVLIGAATTIIGLTVRYEYCIAGLGYGFPQSIIHPSHQEWWLLQLEHPLVLDDLAFDPLGLIINWVTHTIFWLGVLALLYRLQSRAKKS